MKDILNMSTERFDAMYDAWMEMFWNSTGVAVDESRQAAEEAVRISGASTLTRLAMHFIAEETPVIVNLMQYAFDRKIVLDPGVLILLSVLVRSDPECKMWVNAVGWMQKKKGRNLTVADIFDAFPNGFHTDAELLRLWFIQWETEYGNLLDHADASSIKMGVKCIRIGPNGPEEVDLETALAEIARGGRNVTIN